MYVSLFLSLSLYLSFCYPCHVFSSLWSNVSKVKSLKDRSSKVFSKCVCHWNCHCHSPLLQWGRGSRRGVCWDFYDMLWHRWEFNLRFCFWLFLRSIQLVYRVHQEFPPNRNNHQVRCNLFFEILYLVTSASTICFTSNGVLLEC